MELRVSVDQLDKEASMKLSGYRGGNESVYVMLNKVKGEEGETA